MAENREKQIEEIARIIMDTPPITVRCVGRAQGKRYMTAHHLAEHLYNQNVRKQSKIIKEFVRRFEKHIGNCTFTMGQTNDIQYALKKATEEMKGGAE